MSKFLDKVFEAQRDGNGWWWKDRREQTTTVCILSGEYTGTWTIRTNNGKRRFTYSPYLSPCIPAVKNFLPLSKWREARIAGLSATEHSLQRPELWYVLSQLGSVPYEQVLSKLVEEPRREMSKTLVLTALNHLSSHEDRKNFSRKFINTWSLKKSMPAWSRRIPWDENNLVWICRVGKYLPVCWQSIPHSENLASVAKACGLKVTSARTMITVTKPHQEKEGIHHIMDLLRQAHQLVQAREVTMTIRGGRDILHAWDNERWVKLMNMDETIQQVTRTKMMMTLTTRDTEAEAKHREFTLPLPESVRQLTTKEDFVTEGHIMKHCVAGYFHQTDSWYFHIGDSTLQCTRQGAIVQHRAMHNAWPTEEELEIGKTIAKMIKQSTKK